MRKLHRCVLTRCTDGWRHPHIGFLSHCGRTEARPGFGPGVRAVALTSAAHSLEAIAAKGLIARIDELTRHNQHLADQAQQATAHNDALQVRVVELETDLAAARTSLRRMIRNENRST